MLIQCIYTLCWLLLCQAADVDISALEAYLLNITDTKDTKELNRFNIKNDSCDHESGQESRCVKASLCELNKPAVDPSTNFILRDADEGGCSYLQMCCPESKIRAEPKKVKTPKNRGCGYSNPGANILREFADAYGYADYGDFPWMVALMRKDNSAGKKFNDEYIGGGSIIDPSVVITAAHKVDEIDAKKLKCRAGEWDTKTEDEFYRHQERDAKSIVLHDKYFRIRVHNDVALIILKEPFDLADAPHIGVACLEPTMPPPGTKCYSMGWGQDFAYSEQNAVILKKLELPLVDAKKCQSQYRNSQLGSTYVLDKSLTCAGGEAKVDTCLGDGGSPLVCPIPDKLGLRYSVVGMVAYGLDCGTANLPGVYVKIPEVYDWVLKEMTVQGYNKRAFIY